MLSRTAIGAEGARVGHYKQVAIIISKWLWKALRVLEWWRLTGMAEISRLDNLGRILVKADY